MIRDVVPLSGVVVLSSADPSGLLSPLPLCHLRVVRGGHKSLELNLSALPAIYDQQIEDTLVSCISSHTEFLQGFLSLEITGPTWALFRVMALLSETGCLASVTHLILQPKSERDLSTAFLHTPFTLAFAEIISQMQRLESMILEGLVLGSDDFSMGDFSQLCNSLPNLQTVTVSCDSWTGFLQLQHITQLHILCDTKSELLSTAVACFTPHSLPALKQLSISDVPAGAFKFPSSEFSSQEFSSEDLEYSLHINNLLKAVIPLCPNLEGLFLGIHRHRCVASHVFVFLQGLSSVLF